MKSVVLLSLARAATALVVHQSVLSSASSSSSSSSSTTTGIISSSQQVLLLDEQQQQRRRGLLNHPAYFMKTLQTSVNASMAHCGIDFQALTLPFEDATDPANTDPTLLVFDFVALLQHYANLFPATCSATDEQTFRTALDEFETCSSFDIKGVLEKFGDAFIGSIMECITSVVPLLQNMEALSDDLDFPEQCENALLGKNPLGDIIRNTILYPKKILACFTALSESIPSCTVEEWPIPLVGPILQQTTCFIGQFKMFLTHLGEHNLDLLDVCLPEIDVYEDVETDTGLGPPTEINCDNYCSNLMETEVMINFPFSDLVQHLAKKQGFDDVIPRFEEFAAQCLSLPWEGWSYASNDYSVASVKLYPDPSDAAAAAGASSPSSNEGNKNDSQQDGSDNDKSASSSSMTTDNDSSDDGDRFAIGVAVGFIMGLFVLFAAAVMWDIVKCCQKMRKQPEQDDPKNTTSEESKEPDDTGSSGDSDSEEDMYEDIDFTIT